MPKRIEELFTEFKLDLIANENIPRDRWYMKSINIQLSEGINPSQLPHSEVFTKERLEKLRMKRVNHWMVLVRGDTRTPQEILDIGGFHPRITNEEVNSITIKSENILNVWRHRGYTAQSGLVSCTTLLSAARRFALRARPFLSKDLDSYIYLVKAVGAISPGVNHLAESEEEYTVPGGLDAEDMIGFRKLEKGRLQQLVYISNDFLAKHPDKIEKLLNAFTYPQEVPHVPLRSALHCFDDNPLLQPI